jgi:hypothetical protein
LRGEHLKEFEDYFEGFMLAASEVGLDLAAHTIIPYVEKFDEFAEFILENTILDKPLASQIRDQAGAAAYFNFLLTEALTCLRLLASFRFATGGSRLPAKRRAFVRRQIAIAHEGMSAISFFLNQQLELIEERFGYSFAERCRQLAMSLTTSRRTLKRFALAHDLTETLVNDLLPNFGEIWERRTRARELIAEIENCPSGPSHWVRYEEICIKCLRFLFSPPFKTVHIQRRTADNHERRDAILTNNQYGGFWRLIREEFDSRHIVCEFKNKDRQLSKDDLNQLRIYLSRPTIGRFGLLFLRDGLSKSLTQAQRNAYEQSRILILVINDRMLRSMLMLRSFTGAAEHVLESSKAQFEIDY